ncbi:MAG: carboxypeptidase-like regulatory domain-containing protein [Gemmatimonadota bacterium]
MRAIVTLLAFAMAGCRTGVIVEDIGYAVILYGRVQTSGGAPLAGAMLTIKNHHGTCGSGGVENEAATTDADGRYRKSLTVMGGGEGCVRISVAASGFAPDSATLTNVPFVQPPALDSVETNILLREL